MRSTTTTPKARPRIRHRHRTERTDSWMVNMIWETLKTVGMFAAAVLAGATLAVLLHMIGAAL